MRVCSVTHSCLTLCDPMDCSWPGSSVHGIFQARILEWVAISYPRDLSDPWIKPSSLVPPASASRFFTTAPPGKPSPGPFSRLPERPPCLQRARCELECRRLLYTHGWSLWKDMVMSFESYNANSSGSSGKIASLSLFKSFIKIRDNKQLEVS